MDLIIISVITFNAKWRSKSTKNWRHNPDCPVTYLIRLKNVNNPNHINVANGQLHYHNHNHHHNQHQGGMQKRQNSLNYMPSVFQNSYRFPLHFKNVYYYKSLVNLNMRLQHLKNSEKQHNNLQPGKFIRINKLEL